MVGSFSILDIGLIAICLISALLAMYRGFTREILSILSWLLAAAAVLYFVIFQRAFAEEISGQIGLPVQIAQILIGAILFLIVLVIVHLITSRLSDSVLDSRVGMFDRIFGFLFGALRGFILVVIPFLFYEKLYPAPETHPAWIRNAMSVDVLRSTGQSFEAMLIQYMPNPDDTAALGTDGPRYATRIVLTSSA
ncbi:MAG: CvpA family protein [Pseudomonadota bacterium]